MAVGDLLELYNKVVKQLTFNLTGTGVAWVETCTKIPLVRSLLIHAGNLGLFGTMETSPESKMPNLKHISLFRYLFERLNFFGIDLDNGSVQVRDCLDLRSNTAVSSDFANLSEIGLTRVEHLVDVAFARGESGHLRPLRKELGFPRVNACKKVAAKRQVVAKPISKPIKNPVSYTHLTLPTKA